MEQVQGIEIKLVFRYRHYLIPLKNPHYFQLMEETVRNLSIILLIVMVSSFSSKKYKCEKLLPIISVDESPNQEKGLRCLNDFSFPI